MKGRIRAISIFLAGVCLAAAAPLAGKELTESTRWADPSRVRLDVEFPGDGYHATWELLRCDCGDLLVRAQLNTPGSVEHGESLLVGGRAVLSRGFGSGEGRPGSALDAPALMTQLALGLLERAEPAGPASITAVTPVSVEDEINHIHLDTGSATGSFFAPWSVRGEIEPIGAGQRRFDLRFRFHAGEPGAMQQAAMRLSGVADYADAEFPLGGSEPLDGWNLSWRYPEDPAAPKAGGADRLDELRALIEAN